MRELLVLAIHLLVTIAKLLLIQCPRNPGYLSPTPLLCAVAFAPLSAAFPF